MIDKTPKLLLASIPKSGTNLFRVAMFNYLCHLKGDFEPKTYDDMVAAFPNQIVNYTAGTQKEPNKNLLPDGYSDFVYGHSTSRVCRLSGPVIGLYRNPLDYLVSAYFYFYQQRLTAEPKDHPRDIIDHRLAAFVKIYANMQKQVEAGRMLMMAYEDLFERPAETLARAATFYGLPNVPDLLHLAADHSSIRRAREFEQANGYLHTKNRETAMKSRRPDAKFVRDGRIGQWREWFTDEDVSKVNVTLREGGIDPAGFVYDATITPESAPAP